MPLYLLFFLCIWQTCSAILTTPSLSITQPHYPSSFPHFDYVNPQAPKGGLLRQIAYGSFDNLNPFILPGISAQGLGSTFDSLAVRSLDEINTVYGLLAERIHYDKKQHILTITLRKNARFHDNSPLTSTDVLATFNTLKKHGHPYYQQLYQTVHQLEKVDATTLRYHITPDRDNPEIPLILCQMPVLSAQDLAGRDFSKTTTKPLLGSGPYRVHQVDLGKKITYQRQEDYWARDLPVNVGRNNFDTLETRYYRDSVVALTAFKNHEHDIHFEYVAKLWATGYDSPALKNGDIIQENIPDYNPQGMQAFVMNLSNPLFTDPKVRKALNYAFNFAWINSNLFYNSYTRTESFFANSPYQAQGLPSPAVQKILEPYRDRLDPNIFTQPFSLPNGDPTGNNRENLIVARDLLEEAGWVIRDHKRVHRDTGQPFAFTLLIQSASMKRVCLPFKESLETLGIDMHIQMVSPSTWIRRMKDHDFAMTSYVWPQSTYPGQEQALYWGSQHANRYGSDNVANIQDPIIDDLINHIIRAQNYDELVASTQALDYVLLSGYYVIPHWYLPSWRVAYWNIITHPEKTPLYGIDLASWWQVAPTQKATST